MRCRFCQHELTPAMLREQGCGACRGGCRKIHCPYCGEENQLNNELLDKLLRSTPAKGEKESAQ